MGLEQEKRVVNAEKVANDNSAQERLKEIEATLSQLRMVKESLRYERRSDDRAYGDVENAKQAKTKASDEFMQASLKGEEVDGAKLERATEDKKEAEEFLGGLRGNKTVAYEGFYNNAKLEDGAFAEKLKSLGVDLNAANVNVVLQHSADDRVDTAITERIHVLEMQARDTKAELPGEKERMSVELLQKTGSMTEPTLMKFKEDAKYAGQFTDETYGEELKNNVLKSIAASIRGPYRQYPRAVEAVAMEQVAIQVFPGADREELKNKAKTLFESTGDGSIS